MERGGWRRGCRNVSRRPAARIDSPHGIVGWGEADRVGRVGGVVVERVFYRIVRGPSVSADDFKPAKALGKPLLRPTRAREWAEGISVFDSFEHAANRARFFRFNLGRFVVALRIPIDSPIDVEQTSRDRHHFTLYGTLEQLMACVSGKPQRIDGGEEYSRAVLPDVGS